MTEPFPTLRDSGRPLPDDPKVQGAGGRRWLDPQAPVRHRIAMGLLLLVCVLFAYRGIHKALRPAGSDFTIYFHAAETAWEGGDPTKVYGFIYPPFFAALTAPLAPLGERGAAILWSIASLGALLLCARHAFSFAASDRARVAPIVHWLPLALLLRLVDSNLANGQVNAFVLALLVLSLRSLRADRDLAAGLWVGLAAAAKVVPAFLVVYFALRGRPRAAVAAVASAAFLVLVAPIPVIGWQHNLAGLQAWWGTTAAPYFAGGDALVEIRGRVPGQSLAATCYRLLCDLPATAALDEGPRANWLSLPPDLVRWVVRAIGLAHFLAFAWLVTARRRARRPIDALELGLVLCTALILAPLLHKAHFLWMLVGVTALVRVYAERRWGARRRASVVLFGVGMAAIALTTPGIVGRAAATWFLTYNSIYLGLELTWIALCIELTNGVDVRWRSALR